MHNYMYVYVHVHVRVYTCTCTCSVMLIVIVAKHVGFTLNYMYLEAPSELCILTSIDQSEVSDVAIILLDMYKKMFNYSQVGSYLFS